MDDVTYVSYTTYVNEHCRSFTAELYQYIHTILIRFKLFVLNAISNSKLDYKVRIERTKGLVEPLPCSS